MDKTINISDVSMEDKLNKDNNNQDNQLTIEKQTNEINEDHDTNEKANNEINNQSPEERIKKLKKKRNHLKKQDSKDFITFGQFRLLLVYLRQYLELFILFSRMDRNFDSRLDLPEFRAGASMLACWGIEVESPTKTFKEIDTNGAGVILFDEFCNWIISKGVVDEDYDD